ncbi:LTA synthase family protein [Caloramator sp. ALD01]|uniref:LTA synthase family protein n=1 Tax=Caloramator sp. ALD01 TaxID=1031288 RepID=UPI00040B5513|nr:LTA synthase family protein [Caloramator sp. ALD01]
MARKVLFKEFDILLFILIVFSKLVIFNYVLKLVDLQKLYLIIGCFGSTLIIASIFSFIRQNKRVKGLIIADFIISLILLTDVVYNRYFCDVTSVALIKQARLAAEVKDSVTSLIKFNDLLFFVDIVLFTILYIKNKDKLDNKKPRITLRALKFISILSLGLIFSITSVKALEKEQPGITKTMYDKKYIVKRVGSVNFHAVDFYRYITSNVLKKGHISQQEIDEINRWIDEKNLSKGIKYYGSMKGKNLIVVQLEAFQGFLLNKKIGGQEITPNLNNLAKESLVFDNCFYQTAFGGTSDAEFLMNNSLLPIREGSVYYQYAGNHYEALPKKLKETGYFTAVMHANRPGFWNRVNMYSSLGFDRYENENNFNIDDIQGLGLSDKSFFKQAVLKMKEYDKPFYTFLISLSSHYPYRDSQNKLSNIISTGEFEGTIIGDYIKSAKYTDEAVGQFVDMLKKEGLWENSVVVFYGDHYAIPYDRKDIMGKLLYGREDISALEWQEAQKIVAMIHFPKQEIKGHIKEVTGQFDFYPTIANLFGIDAKYTFGRDVLNTNKGFVVLRNGTWITDDVAYLNFVDKVIDRRTGKELNKDKYVDNFERAYRMLKFSDSLIEYDLIPKLKNKAEN